MSTYPKAAPPLELSLDSLGRRCVPLASLRHVLEWQLHVAPEEASLESLLGAVTGAEEAPLPGLTPARADAGLAELPLELAEPRVLNGHLLHPATGDEVRCQNCKRTDVHEPWCPVGQGSVDPLAG